MEKLRVNAVSRVESADIRHFTHNGKPHIMVPSYTLPDNVVMNGGLYPADEIKASFKSLEGTLAPVGHPTVNGVFVKAGDAEAINSHYIGVWNKNVSQVDGRVYIEKWIDVEFASKFEQGQQLLDAIEDGRPIHTSTGLVCKRELAVNQAGYKWIARGMRFDHDAILFDEPGAATPEDGVGMMVNSEQLVVNAICPGLTTNGVLSGSYSQRREAISVALRERFGSTDNYVYVEDFDSSTVIYMDSTGLNSIGYECTGDNAVLVGTPESVKARVEFVAKDGSVESALALVKNAVQCDANNVDEPPTLAGNANMDPKELATLVTNSVSSAVAPLQEALASQAETIAALKGQLTANADATDKANRDVILAKSPELELTVNALSGEPLAALAARFQDAAPIASGAMETNSKKAAINQFNDYEGQ